MGLPWWGFWLQHRDASVRQQGSRVKGTVFLRICLFVWKIVTKWKRERQRAHSILHLLVHCPGTGSGWGWAGQSWSQEPGNPSVFPTLDGRSQALHHLLLFALIGSCIQSGITQKFIQNTSITGNSLTHCTVTASPIGLDFFKILYFIFYFGLDFNSFH